MRERKMKMQWFWWWWRAVAIGGIAAARWAHGKTRMEMDGDFLR